MSEQPKLSDLMVRNVARLIAEGRRIEIDPATLAAYVRQAGLDVPLGEVTPTDADVPSTTEGGRQKEPKAGHVRARSVGRLLVQGGPDRGFVKLQRSPTTDALLGDKNALHLLTVIGLRARWSYEPSLDGLTHAQAQIGDFAATGLTQKEYRCAKQRLEKWGLVRFDPTPLGTIATLLDSRVFSLTDERDPAKQGKQDGQLKGELFSEEDLQNRANSGASIRAPKGRAKGELGATKKNIRREEGTIPAGAGGGEGCKIKPSKMPRERNPLLDALAAIDGSNLAQVTGPAWATAATALKDIMEVQCDVSPEEIKRRAANYRLHMPTANLTPTALSKYWARCERAPQQQTQADDRRIPENLQPGYRQN
jgi:hypothetical protein